MKSAGLSAVCVSKTKFIIHLNNDVLNIQDNTGCEGWTWLSETNGDYPKYCMMFSNLGYLENSPNCVRKGT